MLWCARCCAFFNRHDAVSSCRYKRDIKHMQKHRDSVNHHVMLPQYCNCGIFWNSDRDNISAGNFEMRMGDDNGGRTRGRK